MAKEAQTEAAKAVETAKSAENPEAAKAPENAQAAKEAKAPENAQAAKAEAAKGGKAAAGPSGPPPAAPPVREGLTTGRPDAGESPASRLKHAWKLINDRKLNDADTIVQSLLRGNRQSVGIWKALSAIRDIGGQPRAAKVLDLKARQINDRPMAADAGITAVLHDSHNIAQAFDLRYLDPRNIVNTGLLPRPVRAQALRSAGLPTEAIVWYQTILDDKETGPGIRWEYALTLLEAGRYAEGFAEMENRWQVANWQRKRLATMLDSRVSGEAMKEGLKGKRVAVCSEQGLGDMIFSLRFMGAVREEASELVCVTGVPLVPLIEASGQFDRVIPRPQFNPADVDVWTGDFDVMMRYWHDEKWFGNAEVPLNIPEDRMRRAAEWLRVIPEGDLKVGLCWTTDSTSTMNQRKRATLDLLHPIMEVPGVHFIGLVKHKHYPSDLQYSGLEGLIIDVARHEKDLLDTAAMISQLDLVITIDTAVAHLSGLMGKPCWMLTPEAPYWYWRGVGERTPLYRTLRLVRQHRAGEWGPPVARIALDLNNVRRLGLDPAAPYTRPLPPSHGVRP